MPFRLRVKVSSRVPDGGNIEQMEFKTLLKTDRTFNAPAAQQAAATIQDFRLENQRSLEDPEAFWGAEASRHHWFGPWTNVLEHNFPDHAWFVGGKTNITFNCLDRHANSERRDQDAIVWYGEDGSRRALSYSKLLDQVSRFAAGLRSLGVQSGDRVIIYMPLTLEGAIAMLACARLGAIHSVIYAGLGVGAIRDRIQDAGAKVVIAGDLGYRRGKAVELRSIVVEATQDLELDAIIWFTRGQVFARSSREYEFQELLDSHTANVEAVPVDSEHPLYILYTSGSTGKPKGVVHVHGGYMVGTAYHLRTFFDSKDGDIFWATSDIGWIVGHSYIVYGPLLEGLTSVMREGAPDFPDPGAIWNVVERERINVMFTAPTAVRMFMKFGAEFPARHDLSSLRFIGVAGETLNPEACEWAFEHLMDNGARGFIADNWWQTELGAPTLGTPIGLSAHPGAVGIALAGVDAAVVDENGLEVAPDTGGLLVLRRPLPSMMRTLWGDHERYRQYFLEIPGNVYSAGDVASRDANGYFSVMGRADDVLNVAGHRIGTADVESALVSHPSIAEAAVIGVPDPIKGEAIHAFVVLRAGLESSPLEAELIAHVRHELGPIATPSKLEIVAKLPKTRSGKILRRLLKAQAMGRDPGDLTTLEE
jgi:acetyl-CoA synthetase